jgi:serine/threonine-protein kinase HipA
VTERTLEVHVDLAGRPVLAGMLHARVRGRRESATFLYDPSWLARADAFAIDPVYLPLTRGSHATPEGIALFPAIGDSAPERWGRTLLQRQHRRLGRTTTLFELDYLSLVDDQARLGALRFREPGTAPFVAHSVPAIPPLVRLGALLDASSVLENDTDDEEALKLLLAPGSSLGGARPKASVRLGTGALAIAKFPSVHDAWPVVSWERVASLLAEGAGCKAAHTELRRVAGRPVLLSHRFDRDDAGRIPYLSGLAMLGARDGDRASYLHLSEAIRLTGTAVDANLEELWRRMVFNVLVSNTDDHLRNHGFVRRGPGWQLAPAFDLNPMPVDVRPRVHQLALDDTSADASLSVCLDVAAFFGLASGRAREVARRVGEAVGVWRSVAASVGLNRRETERMASAFEHADLTLAKSL